MTTCSGSSTSPPSSAARPIQRASKTCAAISFIWLRGRFLGSNDQPNAARHCGSSCDRLWARRHREPMTSWSISTPAAAGAEPGGSRAFSRWGTGAQIHGGIECGLWRPDCACPSSGRAVAWGHRQQAHGDPDRTGQTATKQIATGCSRRICLCLLRASQAWPARKDGNYRNGLSQPAVGASVPDAPAIPRPA